MNANLLLAIVGAGVGYWLWKKQGQPKEMYLKTSGIYRPWEKDEFQATPTSGSGVIFTTRPVTKETPYGQLQVALAPIDLLEVGGKIWSVSKTAGTKVWDAITGSFRKPKRPEIEDFKKMKNEGKVKHIDVKINRKTDGRAYLTYKVKPKAEEKRRFLDTGLKLKTAYS